MESFDHFTDWHGTLMYLDTLTMRHLAVQMSANILDTLRFHHHDTEILPREGPGRILADYNFQSHTITNGLQSQVSLVYAIAQVITSNEELMARFHDGDDRALRMMRVALQEYQNWKTKVCEVEQDKMGSEHWGTATGFYRKNWMDLNHKLFK